MSTEPMKPSEPLSSRLPIRNSLGAIFALGALVVAGMAGNYFKFTLFYNVDFIFGSIFTFLVLQIYGIGRGVAAAFIISSPLILIWGHPYAVIIMTAEVAVVGWLNTRYEIGFLQADVIYWLFIGMPLVFFFYCFVMKIHINSTLFIMAKDMLNGLANVLIARMIFTIYGFKRNKALVSHRESLYLILAFFVMCPAMIMIVLGGRKAFNIADRGIRNELIQVSRHITDTLANWELNRQPAIITLARMAALKSPEEMQPFLEKAKNSDINFLRIGLMNREGISSAYSPILDEFGQKNVGKNFADRPFIPILKQTLKPMLSEVVMGKIPPRLPIVSVLAPVTVGKKYAGYAIGVLNLEPIRGLLSRLNDNSMRFTLLDKNSKIIMTNRSDQKVMGTFDYGNGTLICLDENISQWLPSLPPRTSPMERWGKSFYIIASPIGNLTEWKLILEQPVAPFQRSLFANYSENMAILILLIIASLTAAELISRYYSTSLQESEEKFAKAFKHNPVISTIAALDGGTFLEVNDAFCRRLGWSRDEAIGHTGAEMGLWVDGRQRESIVSEVKKHGRMEQFETECFSKAGDIHKLLWNCEVINAHNQHCLLVCAEDITERKQTEEDQSKFKDRLIHTQKLEALGGLVSGVAHTMNNVLAVIMGTASLGESHTTDAWVLKAFNTIGKASMRGKNVVKSLINFTQPTPLDQVPFELNGIAKEVCALLGSTTRNQIKIIESLTEEPLWVFGDAGSINLAVVNICSNSVAAMPNGGNLTLRTAALEDNWVELVIEDNGAGMAQEILARVMEPFFTTKDASTGAGLGLSMTYGVVKAHGGTIDIVSEPGQGTTVNLRFPRIPAPVHIETAQEPAPPLKLRKVLLVDDEEDVRFLMTRMLQKAGVGEVETAASGEEAMGMLLPGELPDVLILDQNMPGMTGVQLTARVRDRYPDLPILFSSGQPDIESWEILKQPMVAVISKPFTLEEIQAKLVQFALEHLQGR